MFLLTLERKRERESEKGKGEGKKEGRTAILIIASCTHTLTLGTDSATWDCALTRKRTGSLLVHRTTLNQPSHSGQGLVHT